MSPQQVSGPQGSSGGMVNQLQSNKDLGKEEFLRLLMTQLSAQDPLNPMDSTQFVAQLSQFASLEQLTNLGKQMDSLIDISAASNAANAVSLLGKEVRVAGDEIKGPSTVFYQIGHGVSNAKLEVRDINNKVVKVIENLPTEFGLHEVTIDGLEPGTYKFRVEAVDSEGGAMPAHLSIAERVKGVSFTGPVPIMIMESGNKISATELVEIREPSSSSVHPGTPGEDDGDQ